MQLEFKVNEQTLTLTSKQSVVANSLNYLDAKFTFSEEWKNAVKTAVFVSPTEEIFKQILENDMCEVPWEVIGNPGFRVSVFGGNRITTNEVAVNVGESGPLDGENPSEPTPSVYEQLINSQKYLTSFYKELPDGKTIDDLTDVCEHGGCYLLGDTDSFENRCDMVYVCGGWYEAETGGDFATTYQIMYKFGGYYSYQVLQRHLENGKWTYWETAIGGSGGSITVDQIYNPTSRNAQSGIAVAEAIASIGGGSGGETFFESSTPQIDMTVEEEVSRIQITTLDDKNLSDYNFTTMKVTLENAQLETAGANSEVHVRINNNNKVYMCTPSNFCNNTSKQYWGGYVDLENGLMLSAQSAVGAYNYRGNVQMAADSSTLHDNQQITRIDVWGITTPIPVGTRIKIWLK